MTCHYRALIATTPCMWVAHSWTEQSRCLAKLWKAFGRFIHESPAVVAMCLQTRMCVHQKLDCCSNLAKQQRLSTTQRKQLMTRVCTYRKGCVRHAVATIIQNLQQALAECMWHSVAPYADVVSASHHDPAPLQSRHNKSSVNAKLVVQHSLTEMQYLPG